VAEQFKKTSHHDFIIFVEELMIQGGMVYRYFNGKGEILFLQN